MVEDRGTLLINAIINPSGPTTSTVSFAGWGMFIDNYAICDGSTLVPGTISGPVFTNGSWNFGTGSYIFTGSVGSHGADAGYQYSDGTCDQVAGTSDKHSGTTIAPTFQAGLNLGASSIALPANSFSQEQAVLDGKGGRVPRHAPCSPSSAHSIAIGGFSAQCRRHAVSFNRGHAFLRRLFAVFNFGQRVWLSNSPVHDGRWHLRSRGCVIHYPEPRQHVVPADLCGRSGWHVHNCHRQFCHEYYDD